MGVTNTLAVPAWLAKLNSVNFLVLLGAALALAVFPAAALTAGFVSYSGTILAVLLALNVWVIGMASAAVRFKFRYYGWSGYVVGAAVVAVFLAISLDVALLWQVVAQQRWERLTLFALALPLASLFGLLALLAREEKVSDRFDAREAARTAFSGGEHEAGPEEPNRALSERLRALAKLLMRWTAGAVIVVQLVAIAATLAYGFYQLAVLVLIEGRIIPPAEMGRVLAVIGNGLVSLYFQHAGVIAGQTALWAGVFFIFLIAVIVPLTAGLAAGERQLAARRQLLAAEDAAWVQVSARSYLDWIAEQPRRWFAGAMVALAIIIALAAIPGAAWASAWLLTDQIAALAFTAENEIFRRVPDGLGAGLARLAGFVAGFLLALAGTQLLPAFRGAWKSSTRDRFERMPDLVLAEVLAGLESAARRRWFPVDEPFDPTRFHRAWVMRGVNLGRSILVWSLVPVAVFAIFDAVRSESWREESVRHATWLAPWRHGHAYREAAGVRTGCEVRETDDGMRARLDYQVRFADGHRLTLRRWLTPEHLSDIERIDAAISAGTAERELSGGSDPAACRAYLRGRWGDYGARLGDLLTGP